MEEWQGIGQGEEDYYVSVLIELWGENYGTIRYGTESDVNNMGFYIVIYLVKGKEVLAYWMWCSHLAISPWQWVG